MAFLRRMWGMALVAVTVLLAPARAEPSGDAAQIHEFEVIIAGGSTAAFAAAIAAAESGARTALIEPTDWVGGQLTSSGVPAIDEAWHTIRDDAGEPVLNVARVARDPRNITPTLLTALQAINDPGDCWVSRFCFCPDRFLVDQLTPLQERVGDRLTVFLDTVVKRVERDPATGRLASLTAIARSPRPGLAARGYDRLPSVDLPDWYSMEPSERFDKRVLEFRGPADHGAVFIDATEWGEVLALADVPYLQGVETSDGGADGDDSCGQATVYCFVQQMHAAPTDDPAPPAEVEGMGYGPYGDREDAWSQIWTYRRIRGRGAPAPGDLCLQNWGYSSRHGDGGNDYPFGYMFLPKADAAQTRDDWQGGVDRAVLAAAELRALAWHHWFKQQAPDGIDPRQITLNSAVLGSAHGLAKLPYVRDTRRAIGLDGFILRLADLAGHEGAHTGRHFEDRIALGAYPADIHPLDGCDLPAYLHELPETLPFEIPFRALTHGEIENLLVAGKTMAQSFAANSATRLHPIEWSSGTAAGVAAAYMARTGKTSRQTYDSIAELQPLVAAQTPIDWSIPDDAVPGAAQ